MFLDHGLLSVKLLRKFPKHYKKGLFGPQDLLELLLSVHAIAMIKDGEYLMPALLPHLDPDQVSKYYQQSTSLIIRPTQGYIPSGLFCCLVCGPSFIDNLPIWLEDVHGKRQATVPSSQLHLIEERTSTEMLTLVDMFSYIALHVDKASNKDHMHGRG